MTEKANGKIGIPSQKLSFSPSGKQKTTASVMPYLLEACEERKGRDPDIDPTKAHLNEYISQYNYRSAYEVEAFIRKRTEEVSLSQGKKVRNDAVVLCNTLLKPNAEILKKLGGPDEKKRFLTDCLEALQYQIGYRVLSTEGLKKNEIDREKALKRGQELTVITCIHRDEGAEHLHVFWEPLERREGKIVYNAKKLHDKKFLNSLNQFIAPELISKGWNVDKSFSFVAATGMERGEYIEKKRSGEIRNGQDAITYKAVKDAELKQREKKIEKKEEELSELEFDFSIREELIEAEKEITKKLESSAESNNIEASKKLNEAQLLEKKSRENEENAKAYRDEAEAIKQQLEELEELYSGTIQTALSKPIEASKVEVKRIKDKNGTEFSIVQTETLRRLLREDYVLTEENARLNDKNLQLEASNQSIKTRLSNLEKEIKDIIQNLREGIKMKKSPTLLMYETLNKLENLFYSFAPNLTKKKKITKHSENKNRGEER